MTIQYIWRYNLIVDFLEKRFLRYAEASHLKLINIDGVSMDLSPLNDKEFLAKQLSSLSYDDFYNYLKKYFLDYGWIDLFSQKKLVKSQFKAYKDFLEIELDEEEIYEIIRCFIEVAYYYGNSDANILKDTSAYNLNVKENEASNHCRSKNIYKILEIIDKKNADFIKDKISEKYEEIISDEEFLNRTDLSLYDLYLEAPNDFVRDGIIEKFWENVRIIKGGKLDYSRYKMDSILELEKIVHFMDENGIYINVETIDSHLNNMLTDLSISVKIKDKIMELIDKYDTLTLKRNLK
jgi:hypothetical protein